ncbi:MAG: ABC transporter ATP-binding protein [Anaerolineae bacterium]
MKIELRAIHKSFGQVHANDGVSLTVESGTIHGLLGENGAGKTTLMKILSGYQSLDAGEILLDGRSVHFSSPADAIAAGIGMLHQDPLDVPPLTVIDNFMLGNADAGKMSHRAMVDSLETHSRRFGFDLDPLALTSSLTIGQRQQAELVRLLAQGVRVIILDEPTTGISAPQKTLLFAALHRLAADGLSVIFVSHKLDEVEALCSQVTVLTQGRLAGEVDAPFDADKLVELMFGRCLMPVARPHVDVHGAVVELQNAEVYTYRLSVSGITLQVRAGESIGLAGLEGSGQRLLMQACAGILPLAAGKLRVDGRDMTRRPHREFLESGIAFVPAARLEEGLIPGLTLREHFALQLNGRRAIIPWGEAERLAAAKIGEYNIIGRPDTRVEELSGGNQQRAVLSLLPDDLRLLILEHPTRGLDIGSAAWIWEGLLERRKRGTAIIFTSTDLDELVNHSDRIVVFSGGAMSTPVDSAAITCEELGYMIGGRGS